MPVYMLRNTVVGGIWRKCNKKAFDSAASLTEYERLIAYAPEEVEKQHQGDPVALPERLDEPYLAAGYPGGWNAFRHEIVKLGPLYTHQAPAVQKGEPVAIVIATGGPHDEEDRALVELQAELPPIGTKLFASAGPSVAEVADEDDREGFEVWIATRKICKLKGAKLTKDSAGNYVDYRINDRWLAWKARGGSALRARISELEEELAQSRRQTASMRKALALAYETITSLMPGAAKIFGLDIGKLNDNLVSIGSKLKANPVKEG